MPGNEKLAIPTFAKFPTFWFAISTVNEKTHTHRNNKKKTARLTSDMRNKAQYSPTNRT